MHLAPCLLAFAAVFPSFSNAHSTTTNSAEQSSIKSAIRSAYAVAESVWAEHSNDPQRSALNSWLSTQTVVPTDALDKSVFLGPVETRYPESFRAYLSSIISDEKVAFSTAISAEAPAISSAWDAGFSSQASEAVTESLDREQTSTASGAGATAATATSTSAFSAAAMPTAGVDKMMMFSGCAIAGVLGLAAAL